MHPIRLAIDEVRRIFEKPREELTRAQAALLYGFDLGRHCARELYHDRATQMAAALTYHTLFSLLPTLVLMLVVSRAFVTQAELEQFRESSVSYVMQWLLEASPDSAIDSPGASSGQAEMAAIAKELREGIQYWLDRLQTLSFEGIGVVGVLLFIYGATGMLATTERSFNQIFGASHNRPWYIRLSMYYTVITLGPLVMIAGHYIEVQTLRLIAGGVYTSWLSGPLALTSPVLATWIVLCVVFVLLPNTRVSIRAAAIGSFIAALGWVGAIELFGLYVRRAASATLYGALALLPLFLFWLWLMWLFLLFGLELTYTLQAMRGRKFKSLEKSETRDLVDVTSIIPMLTLIGRGFEEGRALSAEEIAEKLILPVRSVQRTGERLEAENLLNRIESGSGSVSYALAMPPDRIGIERIIDLCGALSTPRRVGSALPGGDLMARLADAQKAAASHITLANVVRPKS
ncbi:MAG: YihY/virulence factor BrkB family protein [Vicinamibacteria bacterium]|nr:YihY/virulence factor BrkB family protein [Vicinamibacteria bacterium]